MNRIRNIRRVLYCILVLNILVAMVKTIYGHLTNSMSMEADGYHSFLDGSSNIIGLVGIWIASKPADESHPYGHSKYESFASIVIGMLILFTAFRIGGAGIERIFSGTGGSVTVTTLSFIIMVVTIIINIVIVIYELHMGKVLKSTILVADSMHTRSDVLVSLSVIVSLIVTRLGYPQIDIIIGFIIAILVAMAGIKILMQSSMTLCDVHRIDPSRIEEIAMSIDGVGCCHKIRTRGEEFNILVDMHIKVPGNFSTERSHDLAHRVEKAVIKEIEGVTEVIVHIEPQ